jgi:hypothetical protein
MMAQSGSRAFHLRRQNGSRYNAIVEGGAEAPPVII